MDKEELEKEANKALDKRMGTVCYINRMNVQIPYTDGYKDSAEPREKQIQIDAEQIRALQKQNGELTDKARKMEQQIEKMKCCGNCQKLRVRFDSKTNINILYCSDSDMKQIEVGFQMCCCKWEIKEND